MMLFKIPKFLKKPKALRVKVDLDSEKFRLMLDDALSKSMSVGGKTFDKINLLRGDPHYISEVMCWKCGHRWIATYPVNTLLKKLQCPSCNEQGFVFITSQDLDAIDGKE